MDVSQAGSINPVNFNLSIAFEPIAPRSPPRSPLRIHSESQRRDLNLLEIFVRRTPKAAPTSSVLAYSNETDSDAYEGYDTEKYHTSCEQRSCEPSVKGHLEGVGQVPTS
jgi:hypothetical protein